MWSFFYVLFAGAIAYFFIMDQKVTMEIIEERHAKAEEIYEQITIRDHEEQNNLKRRFCHKDARAELLSGLSNLMVDIFGDDWNEVLDEGRDDGRGVTTPRSAAFNIYLASLGYMDRDVMWKSYILRKDGIEWEMKSLVAIEKLMQEHHPELNLEMRYFEGRKRSSSKEQQYYTEIWRGECQWNFQRGYPLSREERKHCKNIKMVEIG